MYSYSLNVQVTAYGRQTVADIGVVRSCDQLTIFCVSNHIIGMAEAKVIRFCTQVGYISSSNTMTYYPQNGRGCGQVKILLFAVRREGLSAIAELLS